MRWACIRLPQLALDGALRRRDDPLMPAVLVAGARQRHVVQAMNAAAAGLGIRIGDAAAMLPNLACGLAVIEHDPADESHWLGFLAAWAYRFSSQVSLQFPGMLLIEVGGSLGLFGPWPQLLGRLQVDLQALGFTHRIAAAPYALAARALSLVHDGFAVEGAETTLRALGQLPIEAAELDADTTTALARMGMRDLRQVWALPRAGLARRFPPAVLRQLDGLRGECDVTLSWYRPPDRFAHRIELGYEVESSQALLFPLRRLTSELAVYLAGRDGGVQRFALHLQHDGLADSVVPVGLLAPERDAALLFELARAQLERAAVPAPVRALALRADELPPFIPAHRELFDTRAQQGMPWDQLRERLRARLGAAAVHGLQVQEEHRPEYATRAETAPLGKSGKGRVSAPTPSAIGSQRPAWLLRVPIPLRGPAPTILSGPERIESGWWDGGDVRRDYSVVQLASGQRAWVYRPVGGDGLMLHGWFA
jgi:protein ImuB